MTDLKEKIREISWKVSQNRNADIIFFNGEIRRGTEIDFMHLTNKRSRLDNLLLIIVTPGGDADVAYRIARCLQDKYDKFDVFIPGWCKSAGTLLAIGAHNIIMSEFGELGPLDIQLGKADEIFEYSSGLDMDSAIKNLEESAFKMFEEYMLKIQIGSNGRVTFKTASEIAANLVTKLLNPVYAQIDPLKIGEISRSMAIAKDYGKRLNIRSRILKDEQRSLDALVSSYPIHSFVIDYDEATVHFRNVEKADEELGALREALGDAALFPQGSPGSGHSILKYLNVGPVEVASEPTFQKEASDEAGAS